MATLELHPNFITLNNKGRCLSMIRGKNIKSIQKIIDYADGLVTATIIGKNNSIYEEYFDFEDVLRDLKMLDAKEKYFKGVRKDNICIKNL